jgi:hypothetical protein
MRFLLKAILALVVGTALGVAATWLIVFYGSMPGSVADGPWRTNLLIGSSGGDAMTRAKVAAHGLFALNRRETIYYTASTDGAGARLTSDCDYRLRGHDPDARWWSITAYAADDYLIPNPADRYSISRNAVARGADGSFVADVGMASQSPNWIPVMGGPFSLTLRLYNPGAGVARDPAHAAMPVIEKVSCK